MRVLLYIYDEVPVCVEEDERRYHRSRGKRIGSQHIKLVIGPMSPLGLFKKSKTFGYSKYKNYICML